MSVVASPRSAHLRRVALALVALVPMVGVPMAGVPVAAGSVVAPAVIQPAVTQPGVSVDGEPCSSPEGVTVVVDLQELGDGTVFVRCADGPVATGLEALRSAGVDHQTTVRFPGFVCRIGGEPADDPCVDAAPAHAYWSYWLAPRGGPWCYADRGAGARTPPPGTVEGWSFARDRGPGGVPPRLAAPSPRPSEGPAATLPRGDCTSTVAGPVEGGTGGTGAERGLADAAAGAAASDGSASAIDAASEGGGVPWAAVVGGLALVAVATAAVVAGRRRRG